MESTSLGAPPVSTRTPDAVTPAVDDAVAPPAGHLRFPLIDGLRAIAAVSILLFHAGGNHATGLIASLLVGVPIFFLISGFLLYRPFVAAGVLGAPAIGTSGFLWRRGLRIIPLYWFVLTVVGLGTFQSTDRAGGYFSGEPAWIFYAFGQVYDRGAYGGGLEQAWTLCIEMTFYLALPVYALLAARLRRRGARLKTELGLLVAFAVGTQLIRLWIASSSDTAYLHRTIAPWFYLFAFGMALAVISVYAQLQPASPWMRRITSLPPELAWAAAAGLYCLQALVFLDINDYYLTAITNAVIATLLMWPAVFDDGRRTPVRRFLAHRTIAWLGLVSYGIYLWHPAVLSAMDHGVPRIVDAGFVPRAAVLLVATAFVAGITYYVIERPVLRLKRWTYRDFFSLARRRPQR